MLYDFESLVRVNVEMQVSTNKKLDTSFFYDWKKFPNVQQDLLSRRSF